MSKTRNKAPAGCKTVLPPKQVNVTVTICSDNPGEFSMRSSDLPVRKVKGNGGEDEFVLTFNNWDGDDYYDGFEVTFDLVDETGKGYGFFQDPRNPDPNDALSVRVVGPSGKCPRRGQRWPGFAPTSVASSRDRLTVSNPNTHLQYFGFALHFSRDGQSRPTLTYDPIGDDQNGSRFAR